MKPEDSIYYYSNRLQSALRLIDKSKTIAKADKEIVCNFIELLKARRVSTGRLAKYAFHLRTIAENLGATFEKAQRKDIERLMIWIDNHGYSPETISDFAMITKRFFKFVRYGNLDRETPVPEEVRWISTAIKPNDRKQPELLTPQEVESLIRAADKIRDKCMISVGFEGGFRASELLLMNVGSVSFDDKGATVRVGGKTGTRIVRLITSVPILARYLETHPLRNNPSGPLWISEATNYRNHRMKWASLDRMLKGVAGKTELKKRIHNHMLRHGSATEAAKFLTESELKIRYGWSMSSRMPAVYVHLSGEDIDDKLLSIYSNQVVQPPKPKFIPITCYKCGESNSVGMRFCGKCGSLLGADELEKARLEPEVLVKKLDDMEKRLSTILSHPKATKGQSA